MPTTDTIVNKIIKTGNLSGPASYSATGFVLDLSASLSTLEFCKLEIETAGVLTQVVPVVAFNHDGTAFAQGKAHIRLFRTRYDKAGVGAVTAPPSGVTVAAAKFAAGTTTGSDHTHAIDHDHPSVTSGGPIAAGLGSSAGLGGTGHTTHTHAVDIANFTGSTATGTHAHDRSFLYAHDHAATQAEQAAAATEIANATNLSATTFRYFAVGL